MAEQMKDIRRRMKSIASTEKITSAMKLVAAAKLKVSTRDYFQCREHAGRIAERLSSLLAGRESFEKFAEERKTVNNTAYVLMTSGRGLCGIYNINMIKEMEAATEGDCGGKKLVAIGSKGAEYFLKNGEYSLLDRIDESAETVDFEQVKTVSDRLFQLYMKKEIDRIVLVRTKYVNALTFQPVSEQIWPPKGDLNENENIQTQDMEMELDPGADELLPYLISQYLALKIYLAVKEAAVCEHSSRRIAMNNASDNAKEMLDKLDVQYNRARQSAITNQIIEIVAGSEAQK